MYKGIFSDDLTFSSLLLDQKLNSAKKNKIAILRWSFAMGNGFRKCIEYYFIAFIKVRWSTSVCLLSFSIDNFYACVKVFGSFVMPLFFSIQGWDMVEMREDLMLRMWKTKDHVECFDQHLNSKSVFSHHLLVNAKLFFRGWFNTGPY